MRLQIQMQQAKSREYKRKTQSLLAEAKKAERTKVKAGKKPFFLKECVSRVP